MIIVTIGATKLRLRTQFNIFFINVHFTSLVLSWSACLRSLTHSSNMVMVNGQSIYLHLYLICVQKQRFFFFPSFYLSFCLNLEKTCERVELVTKNIENRKTDRFINEPLFLSFKWIIFRKSTLDTHMIYVHC